jgi:hypothetical protein
MRISLMSVIQLDNFMTRFLRNVKKNFIHFIHNNFWEELLFFFNFPLYLQSVPIHSANVVKSCTKACKRVLTGTLLYLIGSESSCDLGRVIYKLNQKN